MKKIIIASLIFFTPVFLYAQDQLQLGNGRFIPNEYFRIAATVVVLYLVISFILAITRSILDFRLKSKMVDRGVSEKVAEQFLQPQNRDAKAQAMKAFLILAGLGLGLSIINLTTPIGIHSFAIITFTISLSFLAYFFFIRKTQP